MTVVHTILPTPPQDLYHQDPRLLFIEGENPPIDKAMMAARMQLAREIQRVVTESIACGHCQGKTPKEIISGFGAYGETFLDKYARAQHQFLNGELTIEQYATILADLDATIVYYTNPDKKANLGLTALKSVVAGVVGFVSGGPVAAITAAAGVVTATAAKEAADADRGIATLAGNALSNLPPLNSQQYMTDPSVDQSMETLVAGLPASTVYPAAVVVVIIILILLLI